MRNRSIKSKFASQQVVHDDIRRLKPGEWLNDEVINFYGAMLLTRSDSGKENPDVRKKYLDVHYFNTFFWSKLTKEGYQKGRLAKWTKKVNIQMFIHVYGA
jgi:sentrin-specific protease 1